MKFKSDIDIDFPNRDDALQHLQYHPAGIMRDGNLVKHNTGIYVTDIPVDPFTGIASIDFNTAEDRGYMKLDFLNVSLYTQIKDEAHLQNLMIQEPEWDRLYDQEFCSKLVHIGNHYSTLIKFPEAVNSIPRLMMFMAVIRPAKRHLIGLPWAEVAKTIWDKGNDGSYGYKKAHSCAYAHLVAVHINLLTNQETTGL